MKKYHVILILIVIVNWLPFFSTPDAEKYRTYSPRMEKHFWVEANGEKLETEHKVHISKQLYDLSGTPSSTFYLIVIFYIILLVQLIIRKIKQANQSSDL